MTKNIRSTKKTIFLFALVFASALLFPLSVFAEETPAPYARLENTPSSESLETLKEPSAEDQVSSEEKTLESSETSTSPSPANKDASATETVPTIGLTEAAESDDTSSASLSPFSLGSAFTATCMSMSGDAGWLTCSVINLAATSLSGLYSRMIFSFEENSVFLTFRPTGQNSGVFRTWLYFLLIADLALVVFTIVLVVLRLTHRDSEEFSIQRLSPRLLAAAVLANLSFLICIIIVDTANISGVTIRGFFDLFASAISSASAQISPNFGEIFPENDGSALFTLSLVLLVDTFAYLLMWTILAVREALVTILIFVTPLVFTILISPYWKKTLATWGKLMAFSVISFPICGLLIGLGDLLSTIFLTSLNPDNEFPVALAASLVGVLPYFLFIPLSRPLYSAIRQISDILENPSAWMRRFVKLDASDNDYILENNQKSLLETLETNRGKELDSSTPLARSSETVKSRVDEKNQTGQNLAGLFTATGQAERELQKAEEEEKVPIAWKKLVAKTSAEAYKKRNERRRREAATRKAEEEQIILLARSEEFALGTDYEKMLSALTSLANSLGEKLASSASSNLPSDSTLSPDAVRFGALARFLSMSEEGGVFLSNLFYAPASPDSPALTPAGLTYLNAYRLDNSDVAVAIQKTAAVTTAWLDEKPNDLPDVSEIGPRLTNSILKTPLEIVAQSAFELSRYAEFLSEDKISALLSSEYFSYILSDPEKWSIIEALPAYQALSEEQRAKVRQKTESVIADQKLAEKLKRQAEAEAEKKAERASYLRDLEKEAQDNPDGPEKIIVDGKNFMVFRVPFDTEAFSKDAYSLKNWSLTPYGEPVYSEGTLRWYGTEGHLVDLALE